MSANPARPLEVSNLSVSYGRKRVLANIHFHLEPGRIYGILGPNGAGKSTLFKAILGLLSADSGTVRLFGEDPDLHRKHLAYIPQKDEVDWHFPATVMDIVLMGRYPHKSLLSRLDREDRRIALESLEKMGIANLRDRQIGALSGGQQQRVFIARALCQEADLFFLDEPFVGVDITTEHKIVDILKELAAEGKTLLVVHHDLSSVERYFDSVILLNQRLIAIGPTESAFNEDNLRRTYSGQLPMLHGTR